MQSNKKYIAGVLRGLADSSLIVGFLCVLLTNQFAWFVVFFGCNLSLFSIAEAISREERFYFWCASAGGIICSVPCLLVLLSPEVYAISRTLSTVSLFGMFFSVISITYGRFPKIFKMIDDFWRELWGE